MTTSIPADPVSTPGAAAGAVEREQMMEAKSDDGRYEVTGMWLLDSGGLCGWMVFDRTAPAGHPPHPWDGHVATYAHEDGLDAVGAVNRCLATVSPSEEAHD